MLSHRDAARGPQSVSWTSPRSPSIASRPVAYTRVATQNGAPTHRDGSRGDDAPWASRPSRLRRSLSAPRAAALAATPSRAS
jgi:hypothetical protein